MTAKTPPRKDRTRDQDGKPPAAGQSDAGTTAGSTALSPGLRWRQLTVDKMPYSVLETYHNRLGRLCKANKRRFWQKIDTAAVAGTLSVLFLGAAIGGGVGLLPFLATHPSSRNKVEYIVVLAVAVVVSFICACWRMSVKHEKAESARAIYDDFADTLSAYEEALQEAMAQAELEKAKT